MQTKVYTACNISLSPGMPATQGDLENSLLFHNQHLFRVSNGAVMANLMAQVLDFQL